MELRCYKYPRLLTCCELDEWRKWSAQTYHLWWKHATWDWFKNVCCKHSAARTAVKQATDASPMFKLMKQVLKVIDNLHVSNNKILIYLEQELCRLENNDLNTKGKVLKLLSHKKAILATIPKPPSATGSAYLISNVKKGLFWMESLTWIKS